MDSAARRRSVSVTIAGQRLTLVTDGDEAVVHALAAEVETRVLDIRRRTRAVDTQAVALLVALQMAEELHIERQRGAALKQRLREKGRALLAWLDARAGG